MVKRRSPIRFRNLPESISAKSSEAPNTRRMSGVSPSPYPLLICFPIPTPFFNLTMKPVCGMHWVMWHESVRHLDDLLLRRTRLGLTAPEGGFALLPDIRPVVQEELNWTDSQWSAEAIRYLARWKKVYGVPPLA